MGGPHFELNVHVFDFCVFFCVKCSSLNYLYSKGSPYTCTYMYLYKMGGPLPLLENGSIFLFGFLDFGNWAVRPLTLLPCVSHAFVVVIRVTRGEIKAILAKKTSAI